MGTWPRRTYVHYVETHAQARDIVPLQYPFDEPLDDKNPKIFLSYFSMPFWMDTLDIAFDDGEATFRRILHAYRAAAKDHISQVRKQARAWHVVQRVGLPVGIHDGGCIPVLVAIDPRDQPVWRGDRKRLSASCY